MTAVTGVTGSIQLTTRVGHAVFAIVLMFFAYKKMVGRIETQTLDRIYCQTIRRVRDISRDDRAIIATCILRTPTDRRKENYSIDTGLCVCVCHCVCQRVCVCVHDKGLCEPLGKAVLF